MRLKAASVMVTTPDFHIRVAARGGLGAVMGSKNLKAVMIDDTGSNPVEAKDKAKFREAIAALSKAILADPLGPGFRDIGTPVLVMMINSFGCFPTKNYSLGQFEGAEKISGEYMAEVMKKRPNAQPSHRCMDGCIVSCSNVYTDENGEVIVSGLEYETIGLMGSNCMIDDLDSIARMNRVCNDVGVDTMDIGGAIAVAMEAGLLAWGDGKAALSLVKEIGKTADRGLMIGNGCKFTGEKLGVKRIPQVKGQCLSAYDPRGLKGLGVTYATSPMGGDHTAGIVLPNPGNPSYHPGSPTGQAAPSQFMQTYMAAVDSLGLCMMAGMPLLEPVPQSTLISCISAFTGESLDENYLVNLGTSVLKAERRFNDAAGFTAKDDRLPRFFLEEKLPPSGNIFDVPEKEIDSVNRF
jgi:aldehyde:ferredoxin oxidoreductase